jgi:hypothetical protein
MCESIKQPLPNGWICRQLREMALPGTARLHGIHEISLWMRIEKGC